MYKLTKFRIGYDNQQIKEEYVFFNKRPTKEGYIEMKLY